jgi:GMP synthase-like glutamine amidotransferase
MRVLVIQHEAAGGPGYLGEALERRGATLEVVHLYAGDRIPDLDGYDLLLVMGGVMNAYQEDDYPWLADEVRVMRAAVAAKTPVLGVCLGGQLLARALGAQVHLGGVTEIGLIPIALTDAGRADPLFEGMGNGLEAAEWHYDTFAIPSGAVALAASATCAHQAFRFGDCAYGVQFHPEVTPAMLAEWIREGRGAEPQVDWESFQGQAETKAEALRAQAGRLIDNLLRSINTHEHRPSA